MRIGGTARVQHVEAWAPDVNAIGRNGELFFEALATRPRPQTGRPLFRAFSLGEKGELFDFLLVLEGPAGRGYCFVQVKTTLQVLGRRSTTLPVGVDRGDLERMADFPAPTYVVGVDLDANAAYIVSANRPPGGNLRGIPLRHRLDGDNLGRLWEEVRGYWSGRDMRLERSVFDVPNRVRGEAGDGAVA